MVAIYERAEEKTRGHPIPCLGAPIPSSREDRISAAEVGSDMEALLNTRATDDQRAPGLAELGLGVFFLTGCVGHGCG